MRRRLLAVPATLALLGLYSPAHAAAPAPAKPQIVDPSGDAVGSQKNDDITGVTFEITKTAVQAVKKVRGKKVTYTRYEPKDFKVTMTLAGTASVAPGVSYQIGVDTGCGHSYIYAYFSAPDAGPSSLQFAECGTAGVNGTGLLVDHTFTPTGTTLVWTAPYNTMPKQLGVGSFWTAPVAYTAVTEPVVGYTTADFVPETAVDYAKGDDFKLT